MKEIKFKNMQSKVKKVKSLIESAGNQLFSVHFITRGDGTKRKMVARRHVSHPQYASVPSGKKRYNPKKHNLLTCFDVNSLRYNRRNGKLNGRGAWKSIPLDSVTRIRTGGEIYKMV